MKDFKKQYDELYEDIVTELTEYVKNNGGRVDFPYKLGSYDVFDEGEDEEDNRTDLIDLPYQLYIKNNNSEVHHITGMYLGDNGDLLLVGYGIDSDVDYVFDRYDIDCLLGLIDLIRE